MDPRLHEDDKKENEDDKKTMDPRLHGDDKPCGLSVIPGERPGIHFFLKTNNWQLKST